MHSPPAALRRFTLCAEMFQAHGVRPDHIVDVGGSQATADWLKQCFPQALVTVLNSDPNEEGAAIGDAQDFHIPADLIFAGELIEHLWNPDGLLDSASRSLHDGAWLLLTTPNLACLANRIFLALGWTPGNISPSVRYITGNPMLPRGTGEYGTVAYHKSVFARRGLIDLAKLYGFDLIASRGYSYAPEPGQQHIGLGGRKVQSGGYGLRRSIDRITPDALREGMALLFKHRPETRVAPPIVIAKDVPNPNRPTG